MIFVGSSVRGAATRKYEPKHIVRKYMIPGTYHLIGWHVPGIFYPSFSYSFLIKPLGFIKKTPPNGAVDSIIFKIENSRIPSHKFLAHPWCYQNLVSNGPVLP